MPYTFELETGPLNYTFETDEWSEGEVNRSSIEYARWVQESLNKVHGTQLVVDGDIGPLTRSAIRSFQQKNGLSVDGQVGPQTEAALVRAGASPPPTSGSSPPPSPGPAGDKSKVPLPVAD